MLDDQGFLGPGQLHSYELQQRSLTQSSSNWTLAKPENTLPRLPGGVRGGEEGTVAKIMAMLCLGNA